VARSDRVAQGLVLDLELARGRAGGEGSLAHTTKVPLGLTAEGRYVCRRISKLVVQAGRDSRIGLQIRVNEAIGPGETPAW